MAFKKRRRKRRKTRRQPGRRRGEGPALVIIFTVVTIICGWNFFTGQVQPIITLSNSFPQELEFQVERRGVKGARERESLWETRAFSHAVG